MGSLLLENEVFKLVNQGRVSAGLGPLTQNSDLTLAARYHDAEALDRAPAASRACRGNEPSWGDSPLLALVPFHRDRQLIEGSPNGRLPQLSAQPASRSASYRRKSEEIST